MTHGSANSQAKVLRLSAATAIPVRDHKRGVITIWPATVCMHGFIPGDSVHTRTDDDTKNASDDAPFPLAIRPPTHPPTNRRYPSINTQSRLSPRACMSHSLVEYRVVWNYVCNLTKQLRLALIVMKPPSRPSDSI